MAFRPVNGVCVSVGVNCSSVDHGAVGCSGTHWRTGKWSVTGRVCVCVCVLGEERRGASHCVLLIENPPGTMEGQGGTVIVCLCRSLCNWKLLGNQTCFNLSRLESTYCLLSNREFSTSYFTESNVDVEMFVSVTERFRQSGIGAAVWFSQFERRSCSAILYLVFIFRCY